MITYNKILKCMAVASSIYIEETKTKRFFLF